MRPEGPKPAIGGYVTDHGVHNMTDEAKAFCEKLRAEGLRCRAEFVPISQSRNADKANGSPNDKSLNWRITISREGHAGKSITTDYQQGIGHIPNLPHKYRWTAREAGLIHEACENRRNHFTKGGESLLYKRVPTPELADVLYSLVMDSDALQYDCFEDWADNYGYDTDSRSAEETYQACMAHALKLRHIVDLDAAREAFQDY